MHAATACRAVVVPCVYRASGGAWPGIVVKVGRTLAHIDYGNSRERIETFRLSDGRHNDGFSRYLDHQPGHAERDRAMRRTSAFKADGVELTSGAAIYRNSARRWPRFVKT